MYDRKQSFIKPSNSFAHNKNLYSIVYSHNNDSLFHWSTRICEKYIFRLHCTFKLKSGVYHSSQ